MIGPPPAILRRWGPLAVQGDVPTALEHTRFGTLPWDLRTLIVVAEPSSPLRFLNLNWTLGRTGTTFDQTPDRSRRRAREVVDLQCCLELQDRAITYKAEHPRSSASWSETSAEIRVADRLELTGARPSYRIVYRQPDAQLELELELECWPDLMHWVRLHGVYCHYTTFASVTVRGLGEPIVAGALLDHGWGRHLLPLRVPTGWFRYEVLRLPDHTTAIALRVQGPGGATIVEAAALHSGPGGQLCAGRLRTQVLGWRTFTNAAGQARRLPTRWRNTLDFGHTTLTTLSEAVGPPRTVLGDGCLQAVSWQGELGASPLSGSGYVEQLGNP